MVEISNGHNPSPAEKEEQEIANMRAEVLAIRYDPSRAVHFKEKFDAGRLGGFEKDIWEELKNEDAPHERLQGMLYTYHEDWKEKSDGLALRMS